MSAIPPNWLSSVAQAHPAQARAADAGARDRNAGARAADAADTHRSTSAIDNAERDGGVFEDAEGLGGGRGRSRSRSDDGGDDAAGADGTHGVKGSGDGVAGLDVEA